MRDCHSNVADNQTPHSGHGGPRRGLPPAVRSSGQHDSLLHSQAQEIVSHVQELRHYQHLEFQIDLRRDHGLRSIIPSSRISDSRCTQQEQIFSGSSDIDPSLEDLHGGSRRFQSRQIRKFVFVGIWAQRTRRKFIKIKEKKLTITCRWLLNIIL